MTSHAHVAEMAQLGRQLWGEPNVQQSNRREIRFGQHGSKSIDRATGNWFDHEAGEGGGYTDLFMKLHGHRPPDPTSNIVTTYDYRDADDTLLFQVVRQTPKKFAQRRPDGNGGWEWSTKGTKRVPYRLPELLRADPGSLIFIVEGERDVDGLHALGLVATCNPGGAGKWLAAFAEHFRDRDIIILPDNDEAGEKHAQDVARKLMPIARSIRILKLPELPPKGDASDWIVAGGSAEGLLALVKGAPAIREKAKQNGAHAAARAWKAQLQHDGSGVPLANLANAVLMLRQAPELVGLVAFDEMARHTILRFPVPGHRTNLVGPRPLQDVDIVATQEFMQQQGVRRIGRETVADALDLVAMEHAYHPVRDYLAALRWDGRTRLDTWLPYYLGAEATPYTKFVGRAFMISMIARIERPGCKVDTMLVLDGEQGAKKSQACEVLGGVWYTDSLPDLSQGDAVRLSMHLRGKWLVEVAELSSISKAEVGHLKSFLTRRAEIYTPKYGRRETREERMCVFAGTTNAPVYLKDSTGGRRFLGVKVGTIDIEALRHDRDQLFAEAAVAFQAGEPWWPNAEFEREHIRPEQEARYDADAWETPIAIWLTLRTSCSLLEVANDALHIETPKLGRTEQLRIAGALERLGWRRAEKRGTGGTKLWERGNGATE